MTTKFYISNHGSEPLLLRRVTDTSGLHDAMFHDGKWQSTVLIGQHMAGENDWVESATEAQARKAAPAAFA